jgi:hypothetical protein
MIKLQLLNKTEKCESITLNYRWADIKLILDKTYERDKPIMINLSPMLIRR